MSQCIKTRRGSGSLTPPSSWFSYNGVYEEVDDGNGNWRIKFLTSGSFMLNFPESLSIDVFLVGGGGAGGNSGGAPASGGGGGGYTLTSKSIAIVSGKYYPIWIGSGGAPSGGDKGNNGGSTSAFGVSVNGGVGGGDPRTYYHAQGGNGGSGGGCGGSSYTPYPGAGGSDGSNGYGQYSPGTAGAGQGTTTREFGDPAGQLYSGGGGGAGSDGVGQGGGENGGAAGSRTNTQEYSNATYYGGGGGGGNGSFPGNGYQGIAIIRNAREAVA